MKMTRRLFLAIRKMKKLDSKESILNTLYDYTIISKYNLSFFITILAIIL